MLIEVHTCEQIRTGVRVFYSIEDSKGVADVKTIIPDESLENYIAENELNREFFTNWKHVTLECDGLDERFVPVDEYLTENLTEVVLAYLQANYDKIKEVA